MSIDSFVTVKKIQGIIPEEGIMFPFKINSLLLKKPLERSG